MKLVICEKNIAARRIASILSSGQAKNAHKGKVPVYEFVKDGEPWKIIGLRGHIITLDYPAEFNQWKTIAPRDLIDVEPCKKVTEKTIAASLKSLVDANPYVIVATDYDREGELIGVEVVNLLKEYNHAIGTIKRAHFSAITPYEIKDAFAALKEVDYNLSAAGESRQIIDLIWGAVLTRFISLTSQRLGRDFLSIGRVQSPTLGLLVEREKEIVQFEPKTFWKILATLKKGQPFQVSHETGQFWEEQEVTKIFEKIKDATTATVGKVEVNTIKEMPPSPFSTTTFLQAASALGISATKAMSIAEELYMKGLISYPRTDNTVYPPSLNLKGIVEKLRSSFLAEEAEEVLHNGRRYPTRGKKKTTDHPPIHPVSVPGSGKSLQGDHQKLYELICRRFLATLAQDAVAETVDAAFNIKGEPFVAQGYKVIEPHWKRIYIYFKERRTALPKLSTGEVLDVQSLDLKKDTTKPPARYTQGSLIAKMEALGLGTKSTRHDIINKLYVRKYIKLLPLAPTPIGIAVVEALEGCDVIKPRMTAILEEDMSKIGEGQKTLQETVKESRDMLKQVMDELEKQKDTIKNNIKDAHRKQLTMGICPVCQKDLVMKYSRKGKRFVSCTGYPDCRNIYPIPQRGSIMSTGKACSSCGAPIVKVKSKGKRAWQLCINPECSAKKPVKQEN